MRKISIIIIVIMLLTSATAFAYDENGEGIIYSNFTFYKCNSTLIVNGEPIELEIYRTKDYHMMFKIRDIAMILNGTENQFNVEWNDDYQAINLIRKEPYQEVGGELQPTNGPDKFTPIIGESIEICIDDSLPRGTAENIGGDWYTHIGWLETNLGFRIDYGNNLNDAFVLETIPYIKNYHYTPSSKPKYSFSETPLDYVYNVYVNGSGYINFGEDKPFLNEHGEVYLPMEHIAHLCNYDFEYDAEKGEAVAYIKFTEEERNNYILGRSGLDYIWKVKEDGTPIYTRVDQYGEPIKDRFYYISSLKLTFKDESNTYMIERINKINAHGKKFREEGKVEYSIYDGMQTLVDEFTHNNTLTISDGKRDFNVIFKDGKPYWRYDFIEVLDGAGEIPFGFRTYKDTDKSIIYVGTDRYIQDLRNAAAAVKDKPVTMEEIEEIQDQYEKMIEDLFKDVPDYVPPQQ